MHFPFCLQTILKALLNMADWTPLAPPHVLSHSTLTCFALCYGLRKVFHMCHLLDPYGFWPLLTHHNFKTIGYSVFDPHKII
jgi:hypothetical protein